MDFPLNDFPLSNLVELKISDHVYIVSLYFFFPPSPPPQKNHVYTHADLLGQHGNFPFGKAYRSGK